MVTMANKVVGFVKKHKKELLIGAGVLTVGIVGGVLGGKFISYKLKYPHEVRIKSDNKDYIAALKDYVCWNEGMKFDDAYIGYGLTSSDVTEKVSELVNDGSGDYLYGMLVERIKND
jgi:hypothetical protein